MYIKIHTVSAQNAKLKLDSAKWICHFNHLTDLLTGNCDLLSVSNSIRPNNQTEKFRKHWATKDVTYDISLSLDANSSLFLVTTVILPRFSGVLSLHSYITYSKSILRLL